MTEINCNSYCKNSAKLTKEDISLKKSVSSQDQQCNYILIKINISVYFTKFYMYVYHVFRKRRQI